MGFGFVPASPPQFLDRREAGVALARLLERYAHRPHVLILGLPRGGVPVAYEVARALGVPLDVFIVRKLGVPGREELAMGAIASGGVVILNRETIDAFRVRDADVQRIVDTERQEIERREHLYRDDRPRPRIAGRTIILVDDGLATGSTMRAAVEALKREGPARIVIAVPVAAVETCDALEDLVDEVICLMTPQPFYAVGLWYEDFAQVTDAEVHDLLLAASPAV